MLVELIVAMQSVLKAPLSNINNETIRGLSDDESKKALGLAIKTIEYQEKQMNVLVGERSSGELLTELYKRQGRMFMKCAEEAEQELLQRKLTTIFTLALLR